MAAMIWLTRRHLEQDGPRLILRYPTSAALLVVGSATIGLAMAWVLLGLGAPGAALGALVLGLWVLVTVVNTGWLLWWQTLVFDPVQDRVGQGPLRVGAVSAIRVIEQRATRWERVPAALQVVFAEATGRERRYRIAGVTAAQAPELGAQLAGALGVPFR
jgi:hypothetical protein